MKKLLIISILLCSLSLSATKYYLSPNGNDSNSGTINSPFFNLSKVWTLISAGDTVYMRGGTYSYTSQQVMTGKNGTSGNMIKVWAFPGETPVITKGNPYSYNNDYGYGCYFNGDYFHIKGIEITGFSQETPEVWHALRAYGNHNIFELLNIHHNGGGMILADNSDDNLILNCDFHHQSDPLSPTPYNNGSGLSVAYIQYGSTNTVRGCRFWWNVGDGMDCYYNEGTVIMDSCWSFYNGFLIDTFIPSRETLGDGAGYKMGDQQNDHTNEIQRMIKNCLAFKNKSSGFFDNESQCRVQADNNTAYLNGNIGFQIGDYAHIIRNNIGYQNYYDGCFGVHHQNLVILNNTFLSCDVNNPAYFVSDADFLSLDPTGIDGPRQSNGNLPDLPFLKLAAGSDLIDTGIDVGLPYYSTFPDLGCAEYTSGSTNQPPVILNQSFQINENSPDATFVGTVVATDPNAGQTLTYSILSGNTNNAFAINSSTGALTVSNTSALNYEVTPSFALIIKVQDNGTGNLSSQATISVTILNINERPIIYNQTFQ